MDVSIYLARFLGLYILIVGAAVLIRWDQMAAIVKAFFFDPPLVYLSGAMALIFGLVIVLFHNIWALDWRLAITIVGYLAVLKGLLRLWVPDRLQVLVFRDVSFRAAVVVGIVLMLLGVYFLHHGFLASH